MKNVVIALLFITIGMSACQNETPSELAEKREALELKRQELKEKQELAALTQEMKTVEAEIDKTKGKKLPQPVSVRTAATGRILGENVILRADNSTQSVKLSNFYNGEVVNILTLKSNATDGLTWYQVRRSDNQVGWVFGRFLEEI